MSDKLYTLEEIREKVKPIAAAYGVERVYLFGSYARGEATAESDLDFRIDAGRTEDDAALLTVARVIDVKIAVRRERTEGPGLAVRKPYHRNDDSGRI